MKTKKPPIELIKGRAGNSGQFNIVHRHSTTTPRPVSSVEPEGSALDAAVFAMTHRTPQQIADAQARAMKAYRPERIVPPGKTLAEIVSGQWPGDETDEQIEMAL